MPFAIAQKLNQAIFNERLTCQSTDYLFKMRAFDLAAALGAAALCSGVQIVKSDSCPAPPPASNFLQHNYTDTWYEIGKIQTAGGAIFESSCVCTQLIGSPAADGKPGDLDVLNSCRSKTATGPFINATGYLTQWSGAGAAPGWFEEAFIPGLPTVNYTVIAVGDDYSVEYDCGEFLGIVNYCVHILSRTPTMEPSLLSSLISLANDTLKLNLYNLPFNLTQQAGCW